MKLRFALGAIWLACSGLAGAQTLEQAVAQAVESHPKLLARYARYEAALAERQGARSEYLPQVSVNAEIGPEDTRYTSGRYVGKTLTRDEIGLRVSQMLFDGFRTPANSERLWQEAESERLGLKSDAENLALEVTGVYLEVLKSREIVELAQRNVDDHERILADIQGLTKKGYSSESDLAQVASRLASARASLAAARNNLADQNAKFLGLVGMRPAQLTAPRYDASLVPPSLDAALDAARSTHPELAAAQADVKAAEQEIRVNRSGYYPRFSVQAAARNGHDQGGYEGRENDARIMLMMEYDIFNGGRDRAKERTSAWHYSEAQNIQRKATLQVEEGTELAWNALASLREQLGYFQASVDAASAAEAGYMTQFELSRRTLLDVLNAKIEVFSARRNYVSGKYDQIQAAFRVLNATGRLSYALRVTPPQEFGSKEK